MHRRHHRRTLAAAGLATSIVLGGATVPGAGAETRATPAAAAETATSISGTDAPVRVHVGAPLTPVAVTVVTAGEVDAAGTRLVDSRRTTVAQASSAGPETGRPRVQKMSVGVVGRDVPHWGAMTWEITAWTASDGDCAFGTTSVTTDVRAHAMLGLAASRTGSTVRIKGSLRAYHNLEGRYVAWSGRPVSVQRWTGSSWVQVAGVRTNAQGDVALTLGVPKGAQLRLVAADTSGTWGATSRTATA
ncbi:hypothetical protein WDZ17_11040 [Pseudokineococcus basanitobsidens]|uniref:Uncharacterized protein n=1 Tax=Pseudokineococcus basanitobsidens TaxID=1926649 RepID=A0ABU8RL73_9ACTN